jgi:hypothetical protein
MNVLDYFGFTAGNDIVLEIILGGNFFLELGYAEIWALVRDILCPVETCALVGDVLRPVEIWAWMRDVLCPLEIWAWMRDMVCPWHV